MLGWGWGAGEGPWPGCHDSAQRRQPAPGPGVCGGKRDLEPKPESSRQQLGEHESDGRGCGSGLTPRGPSWRCDLGAWVWNPILGARKESRVCWVGR